MIGSKNAVTLLNRFGHGISYTQLEEVQTAMAKRHLDRATDGEVFFPSNINPSLRVSLCFDNNDINEETLSGSGTTHCTNGIMIQKQMGSRYSAGSNSLERTKSRSIPAPAPSIEQYYHKQRCGPGNMELNLTEVTPDQMVCAQKKDFAWFLARFADCGNILQASDGPQCVPGWTGFNSLVSDTVAELSSIGYCPVIGSSATEFSTVYTLLKYAQNVAVKTGQPDIVVTFDQAIYAKAQEIIWSTNGEFSNVVVRMGAFHTSMTFMAVIGKRFGDAGLMSLMVESGVLASGSAPAVLNGKHYNRAIRLHKLVMEALQRLRWQEFLTSQNLPNVPDNFIQAIDKLCDNGCLDAVIDQPAFTEIYSAYQEFCTTMNSSLPLAKFWSSYIEMVQLLLSFTRATREGNWNLHLECIRHMLPWFFAYDRVNYSRFLTVYLAEMYNLPNKHPAAYEALCAGEFVVQQRANSFAQTAVDQTIEQTVNRSTKYHWF